VSTEIRQTSVPYTATSACPPWCDTFHIDPQIEDHIRMVDAVHRKPHLESVSIELEQAARSPRPVVVISIFTRKKKPDSISAGLTLEQARHVHATLGEALRLAVAIAEPSTTPT
jgi:hypothetical protein